MCEMCDNIRRSMEETKKVAFSIQAKKGRLSKNRILNRNKKINIRQPSKATMILIW